MTVRGTSRLYCLPMLVGALCIADDVSAAGDLSGIWQGQFLESQVLPENPGFTPAGRQAQREFDPANDPYLRCIVYMPRAMLAWQPTRIEIIQSETRVWILFEAYHQVRRIFFGRHTALRSRRPTVVRTFQWSMGGRFTGCGDQPPSRKHFIPLGGIAA